MADLVVTGAGGYVGGVLVAAAAERGLSVTSLTRSPAPWLQGEVRLIRSLETEAAAAARGASAVVHLAGPNEIRCAEDPDRATAAAIASSRAVAVACERGGVRRLVYVSTVHVYGAALEPGAVVGEETTPAPRSVYGIARLACEHTILANAGKTEVVIFRLTNSVGAPAHPDVNRWSLVVNDLCRQAARDGSLRLRTAGQQSRDFVALSDVIAIVLEAARPHSIPPGVYNLGSGLATTIRDLADLVAVEALATGLGLMTVEAPAPAGPAAPPYRVSVERLAAEGFRPSTPLAAAIAQTLEFCANHYRVT